MKKITFYLSFIFTFIFSSSFGQSNMIENKKFPIEKLHFYKSKENLKIVVFMPSIYINGYEQMLIKSLKYYFQEGLAFKSTTKPKIDVILIVNEKKGKGLFFDFESDTKFMVVHHDKKGVISKLFGIEQMENLIPIPNDGKYSKNIISSKVFLLDEKNNILLKDDDYHAQGEHLKVLENKIKKHLKIDVTNQRVKSNNFAVGDKAAIVIKEIPKKLKEASNIKTLKENNWDILKEDSCIKVITFYPAAFSGNDKPLKNNAILSMMCSIQIKQLDKSEERRKKFVKKYAISSSTKEILEKWERSLGTYNIIYINDQDYSISKEFGAYNSKGYNNRVTYIIGKDGSVKYIDYDYTDKDNEVLNEKIDSLLK